MLFADPLCTFPQFLPRLLTGLLEGADSFSLVV
jgi:hypothetical protein